MCIYKFRFANFTVCITFYPCIVSFPSGSHLYSKPSKNPQTSLLITACFLDLWIDAYFVSSESRVLRLIPCCSYYWPLLRHFDMNGCLSAIRFINWIQRNVIQCSLQASRCWGFCKLNSFIMLMPLFCQTHHFHSSGVEKSSDGFGFFNKRCLTFNEMRQAIAKRKKKKNISMAGGIWQSQHQGPLSNKKITL